MLDYKDFVSQNKSMLIAPAGYGKTYSIAECLKHTLDNEKQLILTHTHAGIASLKEKIIELGISNSKYNVETITGFAQKYVLAFYLGDDIPNQDNSREYYSFILEKAIELLKYKSVQRVISGTYNGVFIDEYQDCTKSQHELIAILSSLFSTHILGDPMQGIFGFNEPLIQLDDGTIFSDYFKYELETPWRWNDNNPELGDDLKKIRKELETENSVNFELYNSINTYTCRESDLFIPSSNYYRMVRSLLDTESLLIIHPTSNSIYPRIKVIQLFNNRLFLVESIDDNDFYKLSEIADGIINNDALLIVKSLSYKLFNKTGLDNWFNENGFKRKIKFIDKEIITPIKEKVATLQESASFLVLADIIQGIKNLPDVKCNRKELIHSLIWALKDAFANNESVLESMKNKRNLIRRIGRRISGRYIGTTLLTKGLEFDTVIILNAHKFVCKKNLYVALTRATKNLVVFTNNYKLNFN